jgi:isocitrate dehydrogenase (NAD+)
LCFLIFAFGGCPGHAAFRNAAFDYFHGKASPSHWLHRVRSAIIDRFSAPATFLLPLRALLDSPVSRSFPMSKTIAVIAGDGIGPEIMTATLRVLDALDCDLDYDFVDAGMVALEKHGDLLPASTLEIIGKHKVALKGPLTTPIGGGFTSVNVTLRRHFDLYANVRPAISFPGTKSRYENIDIITVRENTEGAYLAEGQTLSEDGEIAQSIIRNTRKGSTRIVRYAFEMAVKKGRKKITAVHKANILKTSTGLFLNVAREIAREYPQIEFNEMIVDNTCMQLVMNPHQFDVIVTTNLFGDILSDLCAGLVGGLGLAPGDNIGTNAAIFEAVHGSAPDIAGRGIANPCALLLAAADMLDYLDMVAKGNQLRAAIRAAVENDRDQITPDLGGKGSTDTFADAIVKRIKA